MKNVKRFLALLLVMVSIGAICLQAAPVAKAATTLYWPVPGHTKLSRGFSDSHGALDINDSSIKGAKIIAAMSGKITRLSKCTEQHSGSYGDCNGSGTGVTIYGDDKRTYSYAHMLAGSIPSNFEVGTYVTAGTQIGLVGTTGNSTGPHLHFSISNGKNYWENHVNPSKETYIYLEGEKCTFTDLPSKVSCNNNDAVIAQTLHKPKGTTATKYGAKLYDLWGRQLGSVSDTSSGYTNSTYIDMWWTVSTGLKVKLWPGQTYQYEFWATVDGKTYTSPRRSFTTTGTAPTVKVNYNANGGSGTMPATTVSVGGTLTLAANQFTRTGYKFAGWNVLRGDGKWYVSGQGWTTESQIESGNSKYFYTDKQSMNFSTIWYLNLSTLYDYTFYAIWEKNPVTNNCETNGHSYKVTFTVPTCEADGYSTYTCSVCGHSYKADKVAAFGHHYSNGTCTTCGKVNTAFTGIANRDGALYYIKEDKIATNVTGLVKYDGIWYYVKSGKVASETTDLVKHNGEWFYVVKGKVASTMTDLVNFNGEWFYVVKGKLASNTTTLIKWNGTWYYIYKGKLAGNTTNLIKYNGEWWYVVKGRVASEITNLVKYNGEWFYVVKGKIASNTTKLVQFNGGWYYIYKGKLAAKTTTLVKHSGSWYYVENGKVNFNYNGKALYNGTYYKVKNGKVV